MSIVIISTKIILMEHNPPSQLAIPVINAYLLWSKQSKQICREQTTSFDELSDCILSFARISTMKYNAFYCIN